MEIAFISSNQYLVIYAYHQGFHPIFFPQNRKLILDKKYNIIIIDSELNLERNDCISLNKESVIYIMSKKISISNTIDFLGISFNFINYSQLNDVSNKKNNKIKKITRIEKMVITSVLNGNSVTSISRKFKKSVKTISNQKQNVIKKLGFNRMCNVVNAFNVINKIKTF